MYGDCQVMSNHQQHMMLLGVDGGDTVVVGGGAGMAAASSDSMLMVGSNPGSGGFMGGFPPLHHNFASIMPVDEVMETGFIEGLSCGDEHETLAGIGSQQQQQQHQHQHKKNKKKRHHRHSVQQIQQMEALFKECPHPDDKRRLKLSQDLGLEPAQIKFWFQNRRTQMKMLQDRSDNSMLRAENEGLKCENYRLRAAMQSVACPRCGGVAILGELSFDKHHILLENARLKQELDRYSNLLRYHHSPSIGSIAGAPPPLRPVEMDLYSGHAYGNQQNQFLFDDHDKPLNLNLGVAAASASDQ